ncbi:hypothetical protein [Hominenteromicrobium sp.]|uniref:hypothetical protein n=1 Tax=Hominenteromicrobium sp. TaxID=3073581 RepID=UPI003AEF4746
MAKANQCDICKNFYVIKWNSVEIEIKRSACVRDYYDVCPECAKKIEAFIKGKTEKLK